MTETINPRHFFSVSFVSKLNHTIHVLSPATAANGKSCIALAADETAAVHTQLWGEECDAFETGDIVKLTNGIFSYVRSSGLVLRRWVSSRLRLSKRQTLVRSNGIPNAIFRTVPFQLIPAFFLLCLE
ncbi:unnamed protein product [Arabis nemorensis]|uniref:Uncharacterized protein n=1 Tax=Arabis nemorensis TaxID=586526 RepID=A0A565CWH9_9BRAS|nr:unnamed protein product [Arabis nemorensis]